MRTSLVWTVLGLCFLGLTVSNYSAHAAVSQEAKPPHLAQKFSTWEALFAELLDRSAYYTAMAASNRLLTVFSDVRAQELAYKTAIWVSDQGHPLPIKQWFLTSTLEPETPLRFAQDFYFFKALANQDRGTKKWADHYLKKLDFLDKL